VANAARVIGPGRAGGSLAGALRRRGWTVDTRGRRSDLAGAADGVDLVVLAVPDDALADVAATVRPRPDVPLLHLSGSRGLEVLAPHERAGSLHPLMTLPDPVTGAERLLGGCTFAVAGDRAARRLVEVLGGRPITVSDATRPLYHAAAAVAANHVTVLAAQVERLAAAAGVPADAYWPMLRAAIDNVERVGAAAALTGPAARGDLGTVSAHLDALPVDERPLYRCLATAAAHLAGHDLGTLDAEALR
jgi:predicted short-subunit dehydrogenase-like oxidoreductase (DUF2520 family)